MSSPQNDALASPGRAIDRPLEKAITEIYRRRNAKGLKEGECREETNRGPENALRRRRQRQHDYLRNTSTDATIEWLAQRYHAHMADRNRDAPAKRLARESGVPTVQCSCGELHPSAVAPGVELRS